MDLRHGDLFLHRRLKSSTWTAVQRVPLLQFRRWSIGQSLWAITKSLQIEAETRTTKTTRTGEIGERHNHIIYIIGVAWSVTGSENMSRQLQRDWETICWFKAKAAKVSLQFSTYLLHFSQQSCLFLFCYICYICCFVALFSRLSWTSQRIYTRGTSRWSATNLVQIRSFWLLGVSSTVATHNSWKRWQRTIFVSSHHLTSVGTGKTGHGLCQKPTRPWRRIFMTFYNIQQQWRMRNFPHLTPFSCGTWLACRPPHPSCPHHASRGQRRMSTISRIAFHQPGTLRMLWTLCKTCKGFFKRSERHNMNSTVKILDRAVMLVTTCLEHSSSIGRWRWRWSLVQSSSSRCRRTTNIFVLWSFGWSEWLVAIQWQRDKCKFLHPWSLRWHVRYVRFSWHYMKTTWRIMKAKDAKVIKSAW